MDRERALLPATAATGALLLAYGVAAVAASDGGMDLPAATSLPWAGARVEVVKRGRHRDCPRAPGRDAAHCGPEHWHWVGPYVARFAGRPQRCIWVHPPAPGSHLAITWPAAELGDQVSATLALLPRAGRGEPVHLRLYVDDVLVGQTSCDDVREPAELGVRLAPGPPRGALRVEVDASDNTWRLACMTLRLRGVRRARTGRGRAERASVGTGGGRAPRRPIRPHHLREGRRVR